VNDEQAIRGVIAEYAQCVDDGRLDDLIDLYEEDASHQTNGRMYRGRDEIKAFFASLSLQGLRHFTSNIIIKIDGMNATARTDWIAIRTDEASIAIVAGGRYQDRFVKRGTDWRFMQRSNVWWPSSSAAGKTSADNPKN
jgi:3-phenylpropionate/cinnamic acid dioxygenase small subunit